MAQLIEVVAKDRGDNPFDLLDVLRVLSSGGKGDWCTLTLPSPVGANGPWGEEGVDSRSPVREEGGRDDDADSAIVAFSITP